MNTFLRLTSLAATVAALALTAAPAQAQSIVSATPVAKAKVKILKGLTLTSNSDLDFGTVVLSGAGAWAGDTVSVDLTGAQACTANLTCSGTTTAATYNVTGSNNAVVEIAIPAAVTITNLAGDTLSVATSHGLGVASTVTMPNSGNAGVDFEVGGSITLTSTTPDGAYEGDMDVTADYQ
jgi:spore coat protein U-like protein